MSHRHRVMCDECRKLTVYDVKKEKLYGEFEHNFAQCEHCGYKATINFTNRKLRSLLTRQKKETVPAKKLKLKEKIELETAELNRLFKA